MRMFLILSLTIGLIIPIIPSYAQSALDTNTRIAVFQGAMEEAEGAIAKGETANAKFYLLAVTSIYDKLSKSPNELTKKYETLVLKLWPDTLTANIQTSMTEFKPVIEKYKGKIIEYGKNNDLLTPHPSMGFDEYAQFVFKSKFTQAETLKYASEYASKAPAPMLQLTQPALNLGSYSLFPCLFNIMFGPYVADELMTKDILPRSIEKAKETLNEITDDVDNPTKILMTANQAKTYVGYALTVDKSNAEALELGKQADALVEKAQKIFAAQVKSNRMPSDTYSGSDAASLKTQLMNSYKKAFPNETPITLVITSSNWVERAEAWWEGDVLHSGVFRFINAAVVVDQGDGVCRVFTERFAREWTGSGDTFGDVYHNSSSGCSYQMLKENIDK